ncbi:MAG: ROK family transcriptional regulator [bacterium]|nr:ROK family transcriptional regulator [bacterium]MDE0287563.1 ROK family transcriptional regulator [bacterium]MDE0439288.1 ROK family transcriptional regulator [bacterium]
MDHGDANVWNPNLAVRTERPEQETCYTLRHLPVLPGAGRQMIDGSGSWALRLRNGQAVFDEFMQAAPFPISRATLARRTGLSKPTVSALVSDLEDAGVVSLIPPERSQGRIGRPAAPYALVPDAALVVGVDMGATKIIVGVADLLGRVLAEDRIETASHARAAVEAVVRTTTRLLGDLGHKGHLLESGCVGVPGVYRPRLDRVEMSPNLSGFADLPIREELSTRLGVPVTIENDVNLAAVAEAEGMDDRAGLDFVAISVGTGIGAGLVMDGRLYRGGHGAAGELGSIDIPAPGHQGAARITLEDVASAPAIRRQFRQALDSGRPSRLERDAEVSELLLAASLGDDAASEALGIAAEAMASAVAWLCWFNDPARIVFGGGVGSNPIFVEEVRSKLDGYLDDTPELVASALGNRAAFIGAISTARASVRSTFVKGRLGR